jgi:small-conductance mechanosensitive channel
MGSFFESLRAYDLKLFSVGKTTVNVSDVIMVLVSISVLFIVAGWLRTWVANKALARTKLDFGTRQAIGTITRYVVLVAGFMIIMQTVGINLSTFNVLAGAVGVGIGFGLQDIVKNFISGLIIMFDRPVNIGDSIEVKGVKGQVADIGARRITMTTPDGITVVVPNAMLITETVTNLHGPNTAAPLHVNVNVSRESDPRAARGLIEEVARENGHVQKEPPPFVRLNMPTGAAFPFELRVWTDVRDRERDELLNELHYALHEKLAGAGVKLV